MTANEIQLQANMHFYLFSTIAQTLGAILALLGVFVVFRVEAWHSRSKDALSGLREIAGNINVPANERYDITSKFVNSVKKNIVKLAKTDSNNKWLILSKQLLLDDQEASNGIRFTSIGFLFCAAITALVIIIRRSALKILQSASRMSRNFGCFSKQTVFSNLQCIECISHYLDTIYPTLSLYAELSFQKLPL